MKLQGGWHRRRHYYKRYHVAVCVAILFSGFGTFFFGVITWMLYVENPEALSQRFDLPLSRIDNAATACLFVLLLHLFGGICFGALMFWLRGEGSYLNDRMEKEKTAIGWSSFTSTDDSHEDEDYSINEEEEEEEEEGIITQLNNSEETIPFLSNKKSTLRLSTMDMKKKNTFETNKKAL